MCWVHQQPRHRRHITPHWVATRDHITLTHIETPVEKRGTGLGARLALVVFPLVKAMGGSASITCGFMRKVAASRPEWVNYFGVK